MLMKAHAVDLSIRFEPFLMSEKNKVLDWALRSIAQYVIIVRPFSS